jgi:hypothetical protein
MTQSVPVFSLMLPPPDVSTVRRFGAETESDFSEIIKPSFNKMMEGQKWVADRETTDGAFGYKNLLLDPSLIDTEFVLDPEILKDKMTVSTDAGEKPKTQKTAQPTFLDLTQGLNGDNLNAVITQIDNSINKLAAALEDLLGVGVGNKLSEEQLDERMHQMQNWSYHNKYIVFNIGALAHSEDFIKSLDGAIGNINKAIKNIDDEDVRDDYYAQMESVEDFRAWLDQLGVTDADSPLSKAQKKLRISEAKAICASGATNITSAGFHRRRVERITEDNRVEKLEEARQEARVQAKRQQEREEARQVEMKSQTKRKVDRYGGKG